MIALRHDLDHPDAVVARESAMRSLTRPRARGLRTALLQQMREVDLRSPAGLYLGRIGSYGVDVARLDRVVRRTMLGLLYRQAGVALPRGYDASAYMLAQIKPEAQEHVLRILSTVRGTRAPLFIGRRVLSYWWQPTREDANATAWFFIFYERVPWIGITAPPDARP